jgi:glucan 1,3-beta-glucosidase
MSWGLRIVAGQNLFSYGTGVWLFFNGWSGTCAKNDGNCQESVVSVEGIPQNTVLYNVNAKSAQNVMSVNGQLVAPRVPWNRGSWGAVVAAYLRFSGKRNA